DRIERRSQIVTHRGQEVALRAIGLHRLGCEPAQLFLRAFGFFDVGVGSEPANDLPVVVALRTGPGQIPAICILLGYPEAELDLIWVTRLQRQGPALQGRRTVLRV